MKTIALTCLVLFASTAFADPKKDAEAEYKQGQSLYRKDDYIGAAHHFKLAYEADPDPVYLFNIAQAQRLAKQCKEASDYYNRFLLEAKNAPNAEAVKGYIAEVDACAKAQQQPIPPPKTTTLPSPDPQPPIVDDPQPHSNKRLIGYIVGGSGVAFVGLGFYFMSRVSALEEDANALCPDPCPAWDMMLTNRRADIDSQAHLREKLMVGSWILGGAAIATGIYLVITNREATESSISITPTSNGAMASIRF